MAGHGDALSDDEDGADLDGADADAIEEACTGLDLLLSSLGRHIQPALPIPPDPDPPVPETPTEPSSPGSIRAGTLVTAGVSDTVLVRTSTSKSSSLRKVKLKQQRLSFGKSSSSVPVSELVVTKSTVRPSLNINMQELVDAIYADALEKYKTKWVLRTGKGATDVQTQAFCKHAGTRKHKLTLEKQEAVLAAATLQARINEHRAAVDAEKIRAVSLLDVLLFVTRCDAPMGTWVKLVQYLAQKGIQGFPKKGYGTYYTTYGYGELVQSMATWLQTTQLEHILRSPFIGISLDKSTNRCRGKHMIVYATFIRDNKLVSEFMQVITVEKADASTLLSLLLSHLQAVGVEVQRISGISTDGARVMMGIRAGLVVRLRERVPHPVLCHCIAHRVSTLLACGPTCFRCCPVCHAPRGVQRFFFPPCALGAWRARGGFLLAVRPEARGGFLPIVRPGSARRFRAPSRALPFVVRRGAPGDPRAPPVVGRATLRGSCAAPSRRPSWRPRRPARPPLLSPVEAPSRTRARPFPVARRGALGGPPTAPHAAREPPLQPASYPCSPRAAPAASCHCATAGWRVWGWRVCEPSPPPPPPSPTAAAAAEGGGCVGAEGVVLGGCRGSEARAPVARETVAPVAREPVAPVAHEPVAPVARESVSPAARLAAEPVTPVARVPVAPVASVPVAPVARVPVAPVVPCASSFSCRPLPPLLS
ncbi:unnamed protein product [Closterium sp. NIES-53]